MPPARRTRKPNRGALGPGDRPVRPAAPGSTRAGAERRLALPIAFFAQLPRWLPFVTIVALVLIAALVEGVVGGVLLLVVAGLLIVLAYVSWPTLPASGRLLRAGAITMIVVAAVLLLGQ